MLWWRGDKKSPVSSGSLVWNDVFYINWGRTEAAMVEYFAAKLRAQAAEVADKAACVVSVTHCAPFGEAFNEDSRHVGWAYSRAYMGSDKLGQVLREVANLRLAIFGHSHVPRVLAVDEFAVANVSVADDRAGPLTLQVPGAGGPHP